MNQPDTVKVNVLLEFNDFLYANYWYLFKKFRAFLVLLFFGGIIYPILSIVKGNQEMGEGQSYWGYFTIPAFIVFMLASVYVGAKKHMKSNKSLQEENRYIFSKKGIDVIAESSSGYTAWSNIREAYETRNSFLLLVSNSHVHTIPKRFFQNDEQVNIFKQLLITELQGRAKLN